MDVPSNSAEITDCPEVKLSWKKMRQKEAKAKNDDLLERCSYVIPKKNRKCRMLVKMGHALCGEHLIHDMNNTERVPCPNDSRHTVLKSNLEKHLKTKCNTRLKLEPWIMENLNAIKSETRFTDKIDKRPTEEELRTVLYRLENVSVENSIRREQKQTDNIAKFLSQNESLGSVSTKHLIQISSIIGHMQNANLLKDDEKCSIVEFGAGKAQLAYWMAKSASKANYLLVDRAGARNKMDNQALKEDFTLNMKRLRCSIEHLDLSKVPQVQNFASLTTVCKHFCGSATDAGIRCMVNGIERGLYIHGMVLVPCCHHKMRYPEYTGHAYLEKMGFCGEADFAALRHISSWSVCGMDKEDVPSDVINGCLETLLESHNQEKMEQERQRVSNIKKEEVPLHENSTSDNWDESDRKRRRTDKEGVDKEYSRPWKEKMGRRAKFILETGRVEHLRSLGYKVEIIEYVTTAISPENLLILGTRTSTE